MEQLAEEAETPAQQKDMKTVYKITRKLRGEQRTIPADKPVKAEDGTTITEERTKLER